MPNPNAISILLIDDNHGDAMLFGEAIESERESRSITLHVASSVDCAPPLELATAKLF